MLSLGGSILKLRINKSLANHINFVVFNGHLNTATFAEPGRLLEFHNGSTVLRASVEHAAHKADATIRNSCKLQRSDIERLCHDMVQKLLIGSAILDRIRRASAECVEEYPSERPYVNSIIISLWREGFLGNTTRVSSTFLIVLAVFRVHFLEHNRVKCRRTYAEMSPRYQPSSKGQSRSV